MKEWYLITPNTRPNITGGFENESFVDYKEDGFFEALNTDLAHDVLLYNSDLSKSQELRCIIEGNVNNTLLSSMERNILTSIGTLHAGQYIFFEDRYWLVDGYPGNNSIYEKAHISLCQYKIRWQRSDGSIIERWANFTSASKYDNGRSMNQYIIIPSNNFTILIPEDDDGYTLDNKRVFIDGNTHNPTKVFTISRSDDVLYLYGQNHGGILSFISTKNQFNPDTDRQDLMLCNYIEPTVNTDELEILLSGGSTLRCGKSKVWTLSAKDADGNDFVDYDFECSVSNKHIKVDINNMSIRLYTDDSDFIGEDFNLQIIHKGIIVKELMISIIGGF